MAKPDKPKKYEDTDKFKSTAYGSGLVEKNEWKELKEKKETKKQANQQATIDDDEIERNKQKLMDKRRVSLNFFKIIFKIFLKILFSEKTTYLTKSRERDKKDEGGA